MDTGVLIGTDYSNPKDYVGASSFLISRTKYYGIKHSKWERNLSFKKKNLSDIFIESKPSHDKVKIAEFEILIPIELKEIIEEIKYSHYILELQDDWDQQGALAVSTELYVDSIKFLLNYCNYIFDRFGIIIASPEINPCNNGTVDLSWRTKNTRLLINIKDNSEGRFAYFYGDYYNSLKPIKGDVPINGVEEFLAIWMKNLI